jgi:hypothetical protein
MKRYLYFGEATVETTAEAGLMPLASFLGMTPASAASTTMHFMGRKGSATDDIVTVTHTGHTTKAFMTEIVKYLQGNQKNPFLIIADRTNLSAVTSMIATIGISSPS